MSQVVVAEIVTAKNMCVLSFQSSVLFDPQALYHAGPAGLSPKLIQEHCAAHNYLPTDKLKNVASALRAPALKS